MSIVTAALSVPEEEKVDEESSVDEVMEDYNFDEAQAKKFQRLLDEGFDEEDAASQALDA